MRPGRKSTSIAADIENGQSCGTSTGSPWASKVFSAARRAWRHARSKSSGAWRMAHEAGRRFEARLKLISMFCDRLDQDDAIASRWRHRQFQETNKDVAESRLNSQSFFSPDSLEHVDQIAAIECIEAAIAEQGCLQLDPKQKVSVEQIRGHDGFRARQVRFGSIIRKASSYVNIPSLSASSLASALYELELAGERISICAKAAQSPCSGARARPSSGSTPGSHRRADRGTGRPARTAGSPRCRYPYPRRAKLA